jgi:hypothetical protein
MKNSRAGGVSLDFYGLCAGKQWRGIRLTYTDEHGEAQEV